MGASDKQKLYVFRATCRYLNPSVNVIKIGISIDPPKRMESLQQNTPFKLSKLMVVECDDASYLEGMFHAHYQKYRLRGEWFALHKTKLSAFIQYLWKIRITKKNLDEINIAEDFSRFINEGVSGLDKKLELWDGWEGGVEIEDDIIDYYTYRMWRNYKDVGLSLLPRVD